MLWLVALAVVVVTACVVWAFRSARRRPITVDPISEKHTASMRGKENP